METYLKIIKESENVEPTNKLYKTVKNEQIEKINSFDVNFIEFENGKWNYQLNQKYSVKCDDPEDLSWNVWYPDFDAMDPDEFFDSLEDAKQEAIIDIDNQLGWGEIVKPEK